MESFMTNLLNPEELSLFITQGITKSCRLALGHRIIQNFHAKNIKLSSSDNGHIHLKRPQLPFNDLTKYTVNSTSIIQPKMIITLI